VCYFVRNRGYIVILKERWGRVFIFGFLLRLVLECLYGTSIADPVRRSAGGYSENLSSLELPGNSCRCCQPWGVMLGTRRNSEFLGVLAELSFLAASSLTTMTGISSWRFLPRSSKGTGGFAMRTAE